ncbi:MULTISPECIES: TrkH family potassium uptake protein [Dysgonomonas]|uniref:TrkH family potassium uptake protein n=1 Tax=Dysgonomonas TaxID=156973 RepID=UPI000927CD27|nr:MULTISPECIES: TrkH family potassium uptake protein [Dysgonomonas]MBN9301029.1 TrkH family potassium uptake protein [Dysgonomonas mossii]OJX58164.1 MAG: potassium transporter [Dysgonomonas sp. 37-18]
MSNFNYRFVLKTIGFLLVIESLFMMSATIVSFYLHEAAGDAMLISSTITFFAGALIRLVGTEDFPKPIGKRESFFMVAISWIVLSAFGMLPYYLSNSIPNVSNAYFETISGLTATGATILNDIESMPKGLLFWRSITQWMGGLGIVLFVATILPMGGNASVMYDAEVTGIGYDRFRPRISQIAKRLWLVYIFLTGILVILLWIGPMSLFDAVCHAFTTISTAGFSTKQDSIAHWNSAYIEYVITLFMFIGGINFTLIYFFMKGCAKKLYQNEEFKWYVSIIILFVVIIAIGLYSSGKIEGVEKAFRTSLFQVVSMLTTTCFSTDNIISWGSFYQFLVVIFMVFGACAGSTAGGIKIVRIIILFKNSINEFKRQVHPNAILPIRLNNHVISIDVVTKVLAFIFLYLAILIFSCLLLSLSGMQFENALGAAVSCLGNVGGGLAEIGNTGSFSEVPTESKWYLSFLMLTGRLELFTVLSLFMPAFWRR